MAREPQRSWRRIHSSSRIVHSAWSRYSPFCGERPAQHAFLDRAQLPERAVAAAVLDGRPRFEPMHAEHIEREVDDEPRTIDEDARAPELRGQREPPLGRPERRLERSAPGRCRPPCPTRAAPRRSTGTGRPAAAGCAQLMKRFEAFDRRRRRRMNRVTCSSTAPRTAPARRSRAARAASPGCPSSNGKPARQSVTVRRGRRGSGPPSEIGSSCVCRHLAPLERLLPVRRCPR